MTPVVGDDMTAAVSVESSSFEARAGMATTADSDGDNVKVFRTPAVGMLLVNSDTP